MFNAATLLLHCQPVLAGPHLLHVGQPAAAALSPAHTSSWQQPAGATRQQQHQQLQQQRQPQSRLQLLLRPQLRLAALQSPACLLLLRLLLLLQRGLAGVV
jgi:hypothetical protein